MGQVPAKHFSPPRAVGTSPSSGVVTGSVAPQPLPALALQPLIQGQIPTMLTPNAVPRSGPLYGQHQPYIPQMANFGGGGHPQEDGYMELLKQREYLKAF